MSELVLEVRNLVKKYGSFSAVNNISFSVPRGKVIGLLGPNGAGKTTTIQILLGISLPTSGEIEYFGSNFKNHREKSLQRINFASAYNMLQGRMSVWENLMVFALLYQVNSPKVKIMEYVKYFEIEDILGVKFWDLSAGQKTRVNLAKSLLNDPELILMDEPTASLDPDIADKTLKLIETLRETKNLSILYTSHDMDEVSRICDQVIFMDRGNIVAQDTPLELTKKVETATLQIAFDSEKKLVEKIIKDEGKSFSYLNKNTIRIETTEKDIPNLIFKIGKAGVWIVDIEVKKPTLEDVFLQIARGEATKGGKNVD